jgi:hypothetical protein
MKYDLKQRLLRAADALHAGAEGIEKYVENLESMGFDFDGVSDPDLVLDAAFKQSDTRVEQVLGEPFKTGG